MKRALLLLGLAFLAACSNRPLPPPPEDAAQVKADAKARDEFARDLPKPREH